MQAGEFFTRATIWGAVLLYAVAYGLDDERQRRLVWTAACGCFLAHVVFAFAAFYGWSHAVAQTETARQTADFTGMAWEGGIYVNYAMAIFWCAEVAWSWVAPLSHARGPRWLAIGWHSFLFFMVVNGAVIFNRSPTRYLGVAVTGWLAIVAFRGIAGRPATR